MDTHPRPRSRSPQRFSPFGGFSGEGDKIVAQARVSLCTPHPAHEFFSAEPASPRGLERNEAGDGPAIERDSDVLARLNPSEQSLSLVAQFAGGHFAHATNVAQP